MLSILQFALGKKRNKQMMLIMFKYGPYDTISTRLQLMAGSSTHVDTNSVLIDLKSLFFLCVN